MGMTAQLPMGAPEGHPGNPSRAALAYVVAIPFIATFSNTMVAPIVPQLLRGFAPGDAPGAAELLGVFYFVFLIAQVAASPVLGALSDRFGRRPVMVVSGFGLALDFAVMALAPSFGWLVLGRLVGGALSGAATAAFAYVIDISAPDQRGRRLGVLYAASSAGAVLGPLFGAVLSGWGVRAPFWVAAGASAIGALYAVCVLPESLAPHRRAAARLGAMNPWSVGRRLLSANPALAWWAAAYALLLLPSVGISTTAPLYSSLRLHWTSGGVGLFLGLTAALGILAQGVFSGPVIGRLGERRAIVLGLGLQVGGLFWAGVAPDSLQFCVATAMIILGGFAGPAFSSAMTRLVREDDQGALAGLSRSLGGVVGLIAAPMFAVLLARATTPVGAGLTSGLTYLVAAALTVAGLGLTLLAARRAESAAARADADARAPERSSENPA
jgi:MFS transporter, DHA1 family, tetracycline resistance protein